MDWIWVLIPLTALMIPIVAILAGTGFLAALAKSLNNREDGGEKVADLEARVLELEAKLSAKSSLDKRLANLETIVTSQTWDALHNKDLSEADRRLLIPDAQSEYDILSGDLSDAQRADLLARKAK